MESDCQAEVRCGARPAVNDEFDSVLPCIVLSSTERSERVFFSNLDGPFGCQRTFFEFEHLRRHLSVLFHIMDGVVDGQFLGCFCSRPDRGREGHAGA